MRFLVFVCILLSSSVLWAKEPIQEPGPQPANEPTVLRRTVSASVATVPGFVVHGAGHFVLGETKTGWKLLTASGVGLGLGGIGGVILVVTGAAAETNSLAIWSAGTGVGLFLASWIADIYGTLNSARGSGLAITQEARIDSSLGYQFVYNPALAATHFADIDLTARWGGWIWDAHTLIGLDNDHFHLGLRTSRRFWGARPDRKVTHGGYIDGFLGFELQRFSEFEVSEIFAEFGVRGRYDLAQFAPTLRGMFVQTALGLAMGAVSYDEFGSEFDELLIYELGIGWNLGHDKNGWSELLLFYDHRHNGYASGLKLTSQVSGPLGSPGIQLKLHVLQDFGLILRAETGSAHVLNLGINYRWGGSR